jgi:AraC family transcriptional regulator
MSTHIPTLWNRLAEAMYLKDSPTAQVSLSELASFSFGRFQSFVGLPEVAQPLTGERGYIVVSQLKAITYMEQFLGNRKVSSGVNPVGASAPFNCRMSRPVCCPIPSTRWSCT